MMWADAIGVEHARAGDEPRIVSLVPSLTETLFELGLGMQVVGRTKWCIHPKGHVEAAINLGGTKKINIERFQSLAATHAVVNVDENPKDMVDALAELGVEILVTHPIAPRDNHAVYELLGGIFGREEEAQGLSRALDEALGGLDHDATTPKKVVYLIWQDPWMTVSRDTYISRMLELVGWETLGHDDAVRYPQIDLTPESLGQADLVLFSSEPYSFTEEHLEAFARETRCSRDKLRLIDGEMTSWFGSRAIQGVGYLAHLAQDWR